MAGYTRQSTASIINGENITAPPLNAEFNELADAFNGSTGHAHDGSTGNGPKIDLTTSVSGYLPAVHGGLGGKNNYSATTNPGVGDDTNDGYAVGSVWYNVPDDRYWVCVYNAAGAAVWLENRFIDTNNDFAPHTNNTVDLGTSLKRFRDLWLSRNIDVDGAANVASTLYVGGAASFAGNVAANSLDVSTNTDITGNLEVTGSSTLQTVDINGGYIDGTDIGTNNRGSGKFTTVNSNAGITGDLTGNVTGNVTGNITSTGTSTFSAIDVNGGAIDGTPIGANDPDSIVGTTITANTRFAGALRGSVQNSDGTVVLDNAGGGVSASFTGNVTGNLTGNVTSNSGNTTLNNLTVNGTADFTSTQLVNVQDPTAAQHAATKAYVDAQVSSLVDSAPGALNTLNELAAAIGDDANFSTTITNSIATKLPLAGGTMTGPIAMGNQKITGLASPATGTDAVNLSYVVSLYGSTASAATSATNAATSASNAATSATQAANSFDTFDDRYLGAKATEPTTDNDGDALVAGAMFFDSTNNVTKIYNGSDWQAASSSIEGIKENFYYTATAGQTVFGGSDDNSRTLVIDKAELVSVYMNGVRLNQENGDYTVSTGNDEITLQTGAAAGDIFEIEVFGNFAGQAASDVNIGGGQITGITSLGVGTSTPSAAADIESTSATQLELKRVGSAGQIAAMIFKDGGDAQNRISSTASNLVFGYGASNTEAARIDASGNLLVGSVDTDPYDNSSSSGGGIALRENGSIYNARYQAIPIVTNRMGNDGKIMQFRKDGSEAGSIASQNSTDLILESADDLFLNAGGATGLALYQSGGSIESVRMYSGSGEALRIDGSRNVLVGKTATAINDLGIELRNNGLLAATRAGNPAGYFTRTTDDGDIIQLRKDTATIGSFGSNSSGGQPLLDINASTTGSSQMRFTTSGSEAMRITSEGKVGIGTYTPQSYYAKELVVDSPSEGGITIVGPTTAENYLMWADGTSGNAQYKGYIGYSHASDVLRFGANGSEKMRLDNNGHLLVGKTTTSSTADGVTNYSSGAVEIVRTSNPLLYLNQQGSDREIIKFRKDNADIGAVRTVTGGGQTDIMIGSDDTAIWFGTGTSLADSIAPASLTTYGTRTDAISLGHANSKFKDLYLSGGAYLGGTAAANKLDDYEEGTWNVLEKNGQGGTMTTNRAHYTKIGNMVYAAASVNVGTTTNTNVLNFTLPFASSINGYYLGGGGVGYHTLPSTVQDNLRPNIENGADNVFFFYGKTSVVACNTASGKRIDFYVIYHTHA